MKKRSSFRQVFVLSLMACVVSLSSLSAHGQAQWEVDADTRIDHVRKANMLLNIVDSNGVPIEDAAVKVDMTRHDFRFGCEVGVNTLIGNSESEKAYVAKVLENCNAVTFGNDFKWGVTSRWEERHESNVKAALDKLKENELSLRVHTLLWGRYRNTGLAGTVMPQDIFEIVMGYTKGNNSWTPPYATWTPEERAQWDSDRVQVKARIMQGMREQLAILKDYKDVVTTWDLINEEVRHPHYRLFFTDNDYDHMIAEIATEIKAVMPEVDLYYNEFSLMTGHLAWWSKRGKTAARVKRLNTIGDLIDGIGSQTHSQPITNSFNNNSPARFYDRIQYFVDATQQPKLRFAITEFDYDSSNTRKFTIKQAHANVHALYKQAFSHANVDEITMWGLWDGNHWKGDSPMYDKNWNLKPQGKIIQDLIRKEWWTNSHGETDHQGEYLVRAFKGDYNITVNYQGQDYRFTKKDFTSDQQYQLQLPITLEEKTVELTNIAMLGTATQSSTGYGGLASRAIDGNTDGHWRAGSTTHTNNQVDTWWQVSFPQTVNDLKKVILFNRADCCGSRLSNFRVSVFDGETEVFAQDYFQTGSVAQGGQLEINLPTDVNGDRVQVKLNGHNNDGNGYLSLAEVQVWSSNTIDAVNVALSGIANQSSTGFGGVASRAIDGNIDGRWGISSTTHTGNQVDAWWQVNLSQTAHDLKQIVLFNRTHCCNTRLSNFRVSVFDGTTEVFAQDYFQSGAVADGGMLRIKLPAGIRGDRVQVKLNGKNNDGNGYLSLAEVQVWASTKQL